MRIFSIEIKTQYDFSKKNSSLCKSSLLLKRYMKNGFVFIKRAVNNLENTIIAVIFFIFIFKTIFYDNLTKRFERMEFCKIIIV